MNDSKYNLEQQVKKQIEAREINPTRDLWSEIETQTVNNHPVKSKMNWFLVAACFLLVASLSIILIFNKNKKIETQIVETQILPKNNTVEKTPAENISSVKSEQPENFKVENKAIVSDQKIEKPHSTTSVLEKTSPILKEEVQHKMISDPTENIISNSNILASTDSINIPKKRKKYVDASTLLFSVEHKDVIEKSKDGSNVATIDLNSK